MRITYHRAANTAYIYRTDCTLDSGPTPSSPSHQTALTAPRVSTGKIADGSKITNLPADAAEPRQTGSESPTAGYAHHRV